MKKIREVLFVVLSTALFLVTLASCSSTVGIHSKKTTVWNNALKFNKIKKVALGTIEVDKSGDGWSVEKEITTLIPLLCLEHNLLFVNDKDAADCTIDVYVSEREYSFGWKKKTSIAVEVLFRQGDNFAAGRTLAQGSLGLSSSKNIEALLRIPLKKIFKSKNISR